VDSATPEQKKQAQTIFADAMKDFDASRFDVATTKFRQSYDVVASPNSRLMIARTLEQQGKLAEAYDEYDKAVSETEAASQKDKHYADSAKAAHAEMDQLRERIALVHVNIAGAPPPEGATLTVGGRKVEREAWSKPIAADPGKTKVTLTLPDGTSRDSEAEGVAGKEVTVALAERTPDTHPQAPPPADAEAAEAGRKKRRIGAYVAGGVGVAGIATFTVLAVINEAPNPRAAALVIGILGVGMGAVLYLTSQPQSARPSSPRSALVVGPSSVGFVHQF
jgi:hypothetical protein